MPHSVNDTMESRNNSHTTLSSLTSSSALPPSRRAPATGAAHPSSSLDNKWKRASSPITDAYADLVGQRTHLDDVLTSPAAQRTATSNTNGTHVPRPKSQYYEDQLQHAQSSARERVHRESPVIAELRTNVIIKDEYNLVTDLSYHLAARYSKPDSAIMINIDHSSCLALGGTFDPCYVLTLSTLPSHMGPAMNRRNAALIQSFMADILSVPPERGAIRFVAIAEENLATNGNTVLGEVERMEQQSGVENGVKRAVTDTRKSMPSIKKNAQDFENSRSNGGTERDDRTGRTDRERRNNRRRSTLNSPPGEVFELAADDGRPSTSHGSYGPENGLRMNGVSREDLIGPSSRTPNGRPKTIAGHSGPPGSAADSMQQQKPKHISAIVRSEQKVAHMPAAARPPQNSRSASTTTTPAVQHSPYPRKTDKPVTLKETIVDNPKVLKSDSKYDTDTAANTAKRRSTISATPKLPAPPPVPESRTPKVSKRKSFLSAFRR